MKSLLLITLCIATLALAILPGPAWAANVAGRVQFAIGDVSATDAAGKVRPLKKGDYIYQGDTVSTSASASAQLKMQDGGFMAIRPDSKLKIDKFIYNGKEDGSEQGTFSLIKGGLRAITGAIGKTNKKNYKIETTVATIGIRGTDHEAYLVGNGSALAAAGIYSKVNVGETTLTTERGTVNVLPNQMGFAASANEIPKVMPVNTNLFSAAPAPTKTVKEQKEEKEKQQSSASSQESGKDNKKGDKQGEQQGSKREGSPANTDSGDSRSGSRREGGAGPGGDSIRSGDGLNDKALPGLFSAGAEGGNFFHGKDSFGPKFDTDSVKLIVPIILTNATSGSTLNATTQSSETGGTTTSLTGDSVLSEPYLARHVALQSAGLYSYSNTRGSLLSPSAMVYVAGGSSKSGALASYTETNFGGGADWSSRSTISGGTADSFNAPSYDKTGIQYGWWSGYTSQSYSNTYTLGGQKNGSPNTWMYAPQGYIDAAYLSNGSSIVSGTAMYGTFTYQLDGANAPRDNAGNTGTLDSAQIKANFTNMTLSAAVALTMPGNDKWSAAIQSLSFPASNGGAFYGYSSGGSGNISIGHSLGSITSVCTTCSGNLNGMFTGQNFAGAILSFTLSDSAQNNSIYGDAALTRLYTGNTNPTVSSGTAAPTGMIIVDTGYGFLSVYSSSNVSTSSGNVLTQYNDTSMSNKVTVNCSSCTATAAGQVASSGIYYGTWTSGSYTSTSTNTYTSNTALSYWITGPEAGPLHLTDALIGTASYALDAGAMSNSSGTKGSVSGSSSLTVNFTKQVVAVNIDASISGHAWKVSTVTGSEAPLTGNRGIASTTFHASTGSNSSNNSYHGPAGGLAVSVDGSSNTSNYGSLDGQFTGSGLSGAIISFSLYGGSGSYFDSLNGIAAFSGTPQNINTPYRSVMMTASDTTSPMLGFWFNNASRVLQDASGNLTQFDTQLVNTSGNASNMTMAASGSSLLDFGTDPGTGISWGRWAGGSIKTIDRMSGASSTSALAGSLHWIAEPIATSPVSLPITGTFNYTYAGGTRPTDELGNVGKLNSASLSANFTAQTVNLGVSATVNGKTMSASGTNAPIIQQTVFYASSQEAANSPSYLSVNCTGSCPGNSGGTIIGKFTGAGAKGAAMSYGLQNGSSTISGVAAFHR